MPRRAKDPTPLMIWRLNQSIPTTHLAQTTGLTQPSVYRIERGEAVSRDLMNKYLSYWGGSITNLAKFPPELKIIDEGWAVRLQLQLQN